MAQYTEEQKKAVKESLWELRERCQKAKQSLIDLYKGDPTFTLYGKTQGVALVISYIDEQLIDL